MEAMGLGGPFAEVKMTSRLLNILRVRGYEVFIELHQNFILKDFLKSIRTLTPRDRVDFSTRKLEFVVSSHLPLCPTSASSLFLLVPFLQYVKPFPAVPLVFSQPIASLPDSQCATKHEFICFRD